MTIITIDSIFFTLMRLKNFDIEKRNNGLLGKYLLER